MLVGWSLFGPPADLAFMICKHSIGVNATEMEPKGNYSEGRNFSSIAKVTDAQRVNSQGTMRLKCDSVDQPREEYRQHQQHIQRQYLSQRNRGFVWSITNPSYKFEHLYHLIHKKKGQRKHHSLKTLITFDLLETLKQKFRDPYISSKNNNQYRVPRQIILQVTKKTEKGRKKKNERGTSSNSIHFLVIIILV